MRKQLVLRCMTPSAGCRSIPILARDVFAGTHKPAARVCVLRKLFVDARAPALAGPRLHRNIS